MLYRKKFHSASLLPKKAGVFFIVLGILNILYFLFGLALGWPFYFGMNVMFLFGIVCSIYGLFKWKKRVFFEKIMDISMVTILVSFLFIEMLIFIGAYVNHDDSPDYVLILGAGIKNEQPSLELRYRLDQSIAYMNRNPEIKKVILCGGIGKNEIVSEAAVMETYLLEHGINSNKIIKENESTSTYENIKNSKEIIQIIDQGEKIKVAIASNDFHLFRAKLIAKRLDLDPTGIPSKTPLYIIPNHHVREYFAIVKSFLFDK